jgi:hypothetical protein
MRCKVGGEHARFFARSVGREIKKKVYLKV